MNLNVTTSADSSSFSVKVTGATKEEAETLALSVKEAMLNYCATVDFIGTHQLELVGENSGIVVDQSLAEQQNRNATAIKNISNNLDKMKNEMTGDQISLYVYRTTVSTEVTENSSSGNVSTQKGAQISFKHLFIGIIVGIILACGLIFVLYLFAPALRNSEEIKTLYGVKVIGIVHDNKFQKKRLFGFIDQFIEKLQNRRKKCLSYEQEIQVACANILLDCKKNKIQEAFLTSSAGKDISEEVRNAIAMKCEEKGIKITLGNAIHYDAEALEQLAQIGNVIFVEKKHSSLYDELYSEISLCKEHDIHVIGMIVL